MSPAQVPFDEDVQQERNAEGQEALRGSRLWPQQPAEVELLYNTNENHRKIAIAVAGMWKKALGAVDVALTNQEWKVYLDTRDKKAFEIARAAWIGDYADASNFLDLFLSNAGERNDAGYNNPEFDDLMKKAAVEANAEKRKQDSASGRGGVPGRPAAHPDLSLHQRRSGERSGARAGSATCWATISAAISRSRAERSLTLKEMRVRSRSAGAARILWALTRRARRSLRDHAP